MKPCPFCGSENQTICTVEYGYYLVECSCGVHGPSMEKKEDAKKHWDTRIRTKKSRVVEASDKCPRCGRKAEFTGGPDYCPCEDDSGED